MVNVRRESATDVCVGTEAPENIPSLRVVAGCAGRAEQFLLVLVNAKHFEARPRGIKITDVQRVAMTKAGGEASGAIRVHDHRVIDNFVTSIAVHVRHADGVRALAGVGTVLVLRVEDPA